jgi:hypothetical protein
LAAERSITKCSTFPIRLMVHSPWGFINPFIPILHPVILWMQAFKPASPGIFTGYVQCIHCIRLTAFVLIFAIAVK